jgi:hypothetical protein
VAVAHRCRLSHPAQDRPEKEIFASGGLHGLTNTWKSTLSKGCKFLPRLRSAASGSWLGDRQRITSAGRLPHRKVGSHRRIALEYLLAYAQTMRAQQADALERMAENARDGRFLCCRVDYIQTTPKTVWLDTTRHQAFIRGVRKGFAAPFSLFSDLEPPPPTAKSRYRHCRCVGTVQLSATGKKWGETFGPP